MKDNGACKPASTQINWASLRGCHIYIYAQQTCSKLVQTASKVKDKYSLNHAWHFIRIFGVKFINTFLHLHCNFTWSWKQNASQQNYYGCKFKSELVWYNVKELTQSLFPRELKAIHRNPTSSNLKRRHWSNWC